jgi:hypothetical protein
MRRRLPLALLLIVITGCTPAAFADDDEMYVLSAALIKLSKFIEPSAQYGRFNESTPSEEILAYVRERDSSLLDSFLDRKIMARVRQKHSVVLICLADGSAGLLEDAGCSPELDGHLWQSDPAADCSFTLNINTVCQE